jgi:hypothetical protein
MDIKRLVADLEQKQLEFRLAQKALAEALGLSSSGAYEPMKPAGPVKVRHVTMTQQVLDAIRANPEGVTRSELVAKLGNAGAIHSALKKHKAAGAIKNANGRWRAVR